MRRNPKSSTIVYPLLGSVWDLGLVRLSGVGLGNSLFNYFHAIRVAEEFDAIALTPAWPSLKPGTLLRGERSKRFYGGLFKPHEFEVSGVRRLAYLLSGRAASVVTIINPDKAGELSLGRLNFTKISRFEFGCLHTQRNWVRKRLLAISRKSIRPNWGQGGYIALHVRLGDFGVGTRSELEARSPTNLRLPLHWYTAVLRRLQLKFPNMPIQVYSDGSESDLQCLIKQGAGLTRGSTDLDDLSSLASASILVGANSTFSRWAAFLGDMPTIWFETNRLEEKPTSKNTPIAFLNYDGLGSLEL